METTAAVTGKVLTPDDQRRLAEETASNWRREEAVRVNRHERDKTGADAKQLFAAVPGRTARLDEDRASAGGRVP